MNKLFTSKSLLLMLILLCMSITNGYGYGFILCTNPNMYYGQNGYTVQVGKYSFTNTDYPGCTFTLRAYYTQGGATTQSFYTAFVYNAAHPGESDSYPPSEPGNVWGDVSVKIDDTVRKTIAETKKFSLPRSVYDEQTKVFYRVTQIEEEAFKGCTDLEELTLPNCIYKIGKDAFAGCTNLKKVIIPTLSSWVDIEFEAGSSYTYYSNPLAYAPVLEVMGYYYQSKNLTYRTNKYSERDPDSWYEERYYWKAEKKTIDDLVLPDDVSTIRHAAFWRYKGLKSLNLTNVTIIGNRAFYTCENLAGSVDFSKVRTMEAAAFANDNKLTGDVNLSGMGTTIYSYIFSECTGLDGTLTLPKKVNYIGERAFIRARKLKGELNFTSDLTHIGFAAFCECNSLTNGENGLDLSGVKDIQGYAFRQCIGLTGPLRVSDGLQKVGEFAFESDSLMTGNLDNAKKIESVGSAAFTRCKNLTGGVDLSGVKTINSWIFKDCPRLNGELKLSSELTSVGTEAFMNDSLMTGNLDNAKKIESVGSAAFTRCKNLTGGVDLSGVTIINDHIFKDCPRLNGELKLSSELTSVGTEAFLRDSLLTIKTEDLFKSSELKTIQQAAFAYCYKLKGEAKLPTSLDYIGDYAFRYCSGLTKLDIPNESSLTYIGKYAFHRCEQMTGDLIIPKGVTEINEGAFASCTSLNKSDKDGTPGKFVLHDDIKNIHKLAFSYCENLQNNGGDSAVCKLPKSLEKLGKEAFRDCYKFNGTLTIPATLKDALEYAVFARCGGIDSLKFEPESQIKVIDNYAFRYCTDLKSIEIPNGVNRIGYMAFQDCQLLTNMTIPNTMNSIWFNAFHGLKNIKVVKLPNSLRQIEPGVFSHNESNYHISFPSQVEVMGLQNILTKDKATEVTVPATVKHIYQYEEWYDDDDKDLYANYEPTDYDRNIAPYTYKDKQTNIKSYFFMQGDAKKLTDMLNNGNYRYNKAYLDEKGVYQTYNEYLDSVHMKNRSVWQMFEDRMDASNVTFYVKPSVYNAVSKVAKDSLSQITIDYKIPVTFKAGLQFTTLCRDFDIDLTAKIIDENGNPTNEKLSDRLRAFVPLSYNPETKKVQLTEIDYIPSRTMANSKGDVGTETDAEFYTGIDQYHGVILMRTGDCSKAETLYYAMGEDDYSKGAKEQMGVSTDKNEKYKVSGENLVKLLKNSWLVGLNDETYIHRADSIEGKAVYRYYALSGGLLKEFNADGWCNGYNKAIFRIPIAELEKKTQDASASVLETFDAFEVIDVIDTHDDDEVTVITEVGINAAEADNSWHTIGGMRLNGKPQQKGVYIHNGKKIRI